MSSSLQSKSELIHVDLSFNSFDYTSSTLISFGLNQNQTILGFHFLGNSAQIDSRGFLIPSKSPEIITPPFMLKSICGVSSIEHTPLKLNT